MTWQAWTTLVVILGVLGMLLFTRRPPYLILLGGLTIRSIRSFLRFP